MAGNFRKGVEASQEAGKGGASFAKTHYFSLDPNPTDPNNTAILRFLTDKDSWIVVDQHNNVPTKGKPADYDGANWPDRMGAVCRGDVAFTGVYHRGKEDTAGRKAACYICANLVDGKEVKKPTGRTWALACLREEVLGDGTPEMGGPAMEGKPIGIRDKTRQVAEVGEDGKPTGNEITERAIVVVNMGYKNFFSILAGFAGYYKTVLDRDYFIKRNGRDKETTYQIVPMDPIPLPDGSIFDCRVPEHAAKYGVTDETLEEIVNERASNDFYARFFDRSKTVSTRGGSTPSPSGQPATPAAVQQSPDVDANRLAALASRVKGYGPQSGAAAPEQPETPAAASVPTPEQAPVPVPAGGVPSTAGSPPFTGMRSFD